ncbi:MAG: hypothetical protein WAL85_06020 [Candidatus Korobacteraceae bacterium]
MNAKRLVFVLIAALSVPFAGAVAQEIQAGTVLPVMLSSTLDARRDKPGRIVTGKIMQVVPLPDGSAILKGSRIIGHVVSASPASAGSPSQLAIRFDQIVAKGRPIPIATHLRALASMTQVFEAKMPTNAWDDYGTSTSDWNTVQVGGAGVYRGNGQVVSGDQVVGHATDYGAVTGKLVAAPKTGCRGSEQEQALWIFSPWACGTYGFNDLKIAHAGKTEPIGQIEFESSRNVHVLAGSGWLLKTESPSAQPSASQ